MKNLVLVVVWAYMVFAILAEVASTYLLSGFYVVTSVVGILAASQAVAIIVFFMDLRNEPGSLRIFALVPIMFLSALLVAMIASLG